MFLKEVNYIFLFQEIFLPEKIDNSHLRNLDVLEKILQKRIGTMVNETMAYMLKLKGDNLNDMDIWNYAQPYYGKKMAFAFGNFYHNFR